MWGYPDVSVNHFSQVHIGDKLLNEVITTELEKVFTAVEKYIYLSRPMDGKYWHPLHLTSDWIISDVLSKWVKEQ